VSVVAVVVDVLPLARRTRCVRRSSGLAGRAAWSILRLRAAWQDPGPQHL